MCWMCWWVLALEGPCNKRVGCCILKLGDSACFSCHQNRCTSKRSTALWHKGSSCCQGQKIRLTDSYCSLLLISFVFCTTILFVRASWVFLTSLVTWHQGVTRRDGASWFLPILQVFSLASPIASPQVSFGSPGIRADLGLTENRAPPDPVIFL